MPEGPSVLDMALSLQSKARLLELGRKDTKEAQRVHERVRDVQAALGELKAQVRTAKTLSHRTDISVDLSGLTAGYKELARRAPSGGLPSDQSFIAAGRKIRETTTKLSEEISGKWRGWAETQLALLPVGRISMLGQEQQATALATLKNLRSITASSRVVAADITLFVTQYEGLKEELAQAPDAPESLLALLNRLAAGALTLHDVTDQEIALLRQHSMDQEIEVRRKKS